MNKKAKSSELLKSNLIYIVLVLLFMAGIGGFILLQMNGASIWGKYYAKELSKIINLASPGDEIFIDIHEATRVASRNNLQDLNQTVEFNNAENEICLKLSKGRKTCYTHFNNVDIIENEIIFGKPVNILKFKVVEKQSGQNE